MTFDDLRRELEGVPGYWPVKAERVTVTETVYDGHDNEIKTDTELVGVLGTEQHNDWRGPYVVIEAAER